MTCLTRHLRMPLPLQGFSGKPEKCSDFDNFLMLWSGCWLTQTHGSAVSANCCLDYGECTKMCFSGVPKPNFFWRPSCSQKMLRKMVKPQKCAVEWQGTAKTHSIFRGSKERSRFWCQGINRWNTLFVGMILLNRPHVLLGES